MFLYNQLYFRTYILIFLVFFHIIISKYYQKKRYIKYFFKPKSFWIKTYFVHDNFPENLFHDIFRIFKLIKSNLVRKIIFSFQKLFFLISFHIFFHFVFFIPNIEFNKICKIVLNVKCKTSNFIFFCKILKMFVLFQDTVHKTNHSFKQLSLFEYHYMIFYILFFTFQIFNLINSKNMFCLIYYKVQIIFITFIFVLKLMKNLRFLFFFKIFNIFV